MKQMSGDGKKQWQESVFQKCWFFPHCQDNLEKHHSNTYYVHV